MALIDRQIAQAKPNGKLQKLGDGNGLQLWVHPSGKKSWHFTFRDGGKQRSVTLGAYPALSLKEARARADDARGRLQREATAGLTRTFGEIKAEWLALLERQGKARSTLERARRMDRYSAPLARQVVELLGGLYGRYSRYDAGSDERDRLGIGGSCGAAAHVPDPLAFLFPSQRPGRPLSENAFNTALRSMGFAKDEVSAHGFRSTFSTMANESGLFSPDAIERALAHVEQDATRRAYHRGEHWEERVRLAQWWADQCDEMRGLE